MFQINKQKFGQLDAIEISHLTQGIQLQIIHTFGALINKFVVNNSPFSFISGYKDFDDLIEQHPFFSRSAKLFPFPNRLDKGQYSYQSVNYQLPANFPWSDHAVHGLLYNQPFEMISTQTTDEFATITLRFSTNALHAGYPFAFQIDITYLINLNGELSCTTNITNLDQRPLPFGDACHPYFSLDCPLKDTLLSIPRCQKLVLVDDLPSGESHPFNDFEAPRSLANTTLNDCFEFDHHDPVKLLFKRVDHSAKLTFIQKTGYRFLQLYTPPSEPSLAIEPMTCPSNAFNNYIGLRFLNSGESANFTWQCQPEYTPL